MDTETYRRNREIGQALARARRRRRKTQEECAQKVGTTRKRYAAIERGTSFVSAVELEQLVEYLGVAPFEVWPASLIMPHVRQTRIRPGESVLLVALEADGPHSDIAP